MEKKQSEPTTRFGFHKMIKASGKYYMKKLKINFSVKVFNANCINSNGVIKIFMKNVLG